MTKLDLPAIRAVCDGATPGPWETGNGRGSAVVRSVPEKCAIFINVRTVEVEDCVARWQRDAEFIALARTALPAACDELEEARRIIEKARCFVAGSGNCSPWSELLARIDAFLGGEGVAK